MTPIWACLDAWVVRRVRYDTLDLLVLLARRPFIEPCIKLIEVVASCFLEIGKVDRIIHVRQRVEIAKANLHRIPTGIVVIHELSSCSVRLALRVEVITKFSHFSDMLSTHDLISLAYRRLL